MNVLTQISNEELLKRYQRADAAAFREFFDRHQRLVFNFLLSRLRESHDAEEAFQQTFFRVHRYIQSYDVAQSAVGWLMTIARNVAIDLKRAAPHSNTVSLDEAFLVAPGNEAAALEARNTLTEIIQQLTAEEQDILRRRLLDNESYEQIANETGLSPVRARKRLSRLLKRLKTQLSPT